MESKSQKKLMYLLFNNWFIRLFVKPIPADFSDLDPLKKEIMTKLHQDMSPIVGGYIWISNKEKLLRGISDFDRKIRECGDIDLESYDAYLQMLSPEFDLSRTVYSMFGEKAKQVPRTGAGEYSYEMRDAYWGKSIRSVVKIFINHYKNRYSFTEKTRRSSNYGMITLDGFAQDSTLYLVVKKK